MKKFVVILFGFISLDLTAQIQLSTVNIENLAEEIVNQSNSDEDSEELMENLLQYLSHPVALNHCTPEELQSILMLSPKQIQSFFEYRKHQGELLNIYELQAIPEFDRETILKILPFVTINPYSEGKSKQLLKRILEEKDAYFIVRQSRTLETRKGFTVPDTLKNGSITSRYLGDPNHIFGRFRIQHARDFSLGFTIEKDPGEQFIWDPKTKRYGFNFFSPHFTLYQKKRWKTITIGDYRVQFGQGLVLGGGFGLGKGAEVITTIRRSSTGIIPYTSAMETGFFRGVAGTYLIKNWEITLLLSHVPKDGNIEIEKNESGDFSTITSLQSSGLHRTPTEISYKNKTHEKNLGFNLQYRNRKMMFGYTGLYTLFEFPFMRKPSIYNAFEFYGKQNLTQGIFANYMVANWLAFGELAISSSGGLGRVMGLMGSLDKTFDVAFLFRNYDRDFHSFYGSSFGETSRPINEKGIYMGLNYKLNSKFNFSFYYDVFEFPWIKFRLYNPSLGDEWMSRITHKPNKHLKMYLQYREERKERNLPANDLKYTYQSDAGLKRNYMFHIEGLIVKPWSFRTRIQGSEFKFNQMKSSGFAMSQDIHADLHKWRVSTRFALFDSDDFDNRQFFFERNVLWAFSMPSLYGQGMRYYLLAQYQMNSKLTFWWRWSRTTYTDRAIISSGLQEIKSNHQSDWIIQMRYQLNR
jgi:hypothetical protein